MSSSKILITSDDNFIVKTGSVEVGKVYTLELADNASESQNKMFHLLLEEWYRTNQHSYNCDYGKFREYVKRDFGVGFDYIAYASPEGIKKAKSIDEIPEELRGENNKHCLGHLKSWSDYTKKERRDTIDRIISAMIQSQVNTKRFDEILSSQNRL